MRKTIANLCAALGLAIGGGTTAIQSQANTLLAQSSQETGHDSRELSQLEKAATEGDVQAQVRLGFMFDQGRGVRQDYAVARQWYEKAANQGNSSAQFNLGVMFSQGLGVQQDPVLARQWYEKAASQGNASAQFNLGVMHEIGKSVRQDRAKAKEYYGKACDQGHQPGCNEYRQLNERGF